MKGTDRAKTGQLAIDLEVIIETTDLCQRITSRHISVVQVILELALRLEEYRTESDLQAMDQHRTATLASHQTGQATLLHRERVRILATQTFNPDSTSPKINKHRPKGGKMDLEYHLALETGLELTIEGTELEQAVTLVIVMQAGTEYLKSITGREDQSKKNQVVSLTDCMEDQRRENSHMKENKTTPFQGNPLLQSQA